MQQPNSVQIVPYTDQTERVVPDTERVKNPSTLTEQFDEEEMINLAHPSRIRDLNESTDVFAASDKGELLGYHYRFGHLPYNKLARMAKEGIIPRRLGKITPPKFAACMFDKLTKRP